MKGSRLSTIPKEQLIHVMRRLCSIQGYLENPKLVNLLRIIGNDESAWLLNCPNWDDDSIYSHFYMGRSLNCITFLTKAANAGFAPAMCRLGGISGERAWVQKAIDLGYKPAQYEMYAIFGDNFTSFDPQDCYTMLYMAIRRNDFKLKTKSYFLSGVFDVTIDGNRACYRFNKFTADKHDLRIMFDIGRELEGFEELWPKGKDAEAIQCVEFYLDIVHKARLAALQVMAIPGLFRDIKRIIARLVYATRADVNLWFMCNKRPRVRKAKLNRDV
jgi:hypothetical protein